MACKEVVGGIFKRIEAREIQFYIDTIIAYLSSWRSMEKDKVEWEMHFQTLKTGSLFGEMSRWKLRHCSVSNNLLPNNGINPCGKEMFLNPKCVNVSVLRMKLYKNYVTIRNEGKHKYLKFLIFLAT